jgi:hypothetical protein
LTYLLEHVGQILDSKQLYEASGNASEWARRVRELRDEFGYQILTNNDRSDLKPGQYILVDASPGIADPRNISKETRAFVLERDVHTCQMCGRAAGDPDEYHPGRTVKLTMGHIQDKSHGGTDEASNLRAICTECNEGLQNVAPAPLDAKHLLTQIRRATISDQRIVLEWMERKFQRGPADDSVQ